MSVIVLATLKGDPEALKELFVTERALMEAVAADARKVGALHHRFLVREGEILILDEWSSPEAFATFFGGDSRVADLLAQAGVKEPPDVAIWDAVDSPDMF